MTDLSALAEAAREDGTTPIFYNEATVASFAAFHYKARLANAASPAVILALLDRIEALEAVAKAADWMVNATSWDEWKGSALWGDIVALRAALARYEEVTK